MATTLGGAEPGVSAANEVVTFTVGERKTDPPKYAADVSPMGDVLHNALNDPTVVNFMHSNTTDGPYVALRETMRFLHRIWHWQNPRWLTLRDRVQIGVIKETPDRGNTSVSMGAFQQCVPGLGTVGFLNCGTGGVKYQLYTRCPDGVIAIDELKSVKGEPVVSISDMAIGSYTPPKWPISFEENAKLLATQLADWRGNATFPVHAFITGTIRQHVEEHPEEWPLFEAEMKRLFEPHGIKPLLEHYFITQEKEGELEFIGTAQMYKNVVNAGELPAGECKAMLGIGQGSSQNFFEYIGANGECGSDGICFKAGMRDDLVHRLRADMADVMFAQLMAPEKSANFLKAFESAIQSGVAPIFALKSGPTLLIDRKDNAHIRKALMARRPPAVDERAIEASCAVDVLGDLNHLVGSPVGALGSLLDNLLTKYGAKLAQLDAPVSAS